MIYKFCFKTLIIPIFLVLAISSSLFSLSDKKKCELMGYNDLIKHQVLPITSFNPANPEIYNITKQS
ncbi:MAG: hypothetical protein ABIA04_05915 [Pseudomonadota bacterium]